MANHPVYFIRHNFDRNPVRDKILEKLFTNREIGIHFYNSGINPDSYPDRASKSALKTLKNAAASDCIIVAAYRDKDEIILGKPCKNGIVIKNGYSGDPNDGLELKTLQLENYYSIKFNELPLLSVLQPPFATIVHWHMAETAVNSFYLYKASGEKGPKPMNLGLLSGWHCEILCEEWLRLNKLLAKKLFKTGKFMKDLDIIGQARDGSRLLAQVKFESSQSQFNQFCAQWASTAAKGHKIYYFTSSKFDTNTYQGIRLISLDDVYNEIYVKDPAFIEALIYG